MCIRVVCVLEYVYTSRRAVRSKKWPPLSFSLSPALLNFRIFTREAKGGGGVNYRYISSTRSAHRREAKKNNVPKKVKKEFHDSSMANCRGGPLLLFRDGAENERK
jgi:hypothetical protein